MTRSECLAWAKERALVYADMGDQVNTLASLASDLREHPELADHPGLMLGMMQAMSGLFRGPDDLRKWVEGFN